MIMQAFATFEFFTAWFIGAIAEFFVVLKSALLHPVSLSFLKNLLQDQGEGSTCTTTSTTSGILVFISFSIKSAMR